MDIIGILSRSRNRFFWPLILCFIFLIAAGFFIFFFYKSHPEPVRAGAGENLAGWIWSENIGWISLNSSNCDPDNDGQSNGGSGCPSSGTAISSYGTAVYRPSNWSNLEAGKFSGYAWSENIGWITFDRSVAGNPPTTPFLNPTNTVLAVLDDDTNAVRGWARAVAGCQNNFWNGSACTSTSAGDASGGWDGWIKLAP